MNTEKVKNESSTNNMATTPINKSQMFILPNPYEMVQNRKGMKGSKYRNIKTVELVFLFAILFTLQTGPSPTDEVYQDMMISVLVGFGISYSLCYLIFKVNFDKFKLQLAWLNCFLTVMFIFISYIIFRSWKEWDNLNDVTPSLVNFVQYYASSKLFSGITVTVTAIIYISESMMLIWDASK